MPRSPPRIAVAVGGVAARLPRMEAIPNARVEDLSEEDGELDSLLSSSSSLEDGEVSDHDPGGAPGGAPPPAALATPVVSRQT